MKIPQISHIGHEAYLRQARPFQAGREGLVPGPEVRDRSGDVKQQARPEPTVQSIGFRLGKFGLRYTVEDWRHDASADDPSFRADLRDAVYDQKGRSRKAQDFFSPISMSDLPQPQRRGFRVYANASELGVEAPGRFICVVSFLFS